VEYDLKNSKLQRQYIVFSFQKVEIEYIEAANENIGNPEDP
jgi:hypothetical protein